MGCPLFIFFVKLTEPFLSSRFFLSFVFSPFHVINTRKFSFYLLSSLYFFRYEPANSSFFDLYPWPFVFDFH
ncbi:hypothetical protein CW304_19155 [Bacillus sp. UFRGS-B20]|nr:hypothetical protein CW304_19155 [Bacillus sp. UFRGS-B20]